jgi:hypothetical protein
MKDLIRFLQIKSLNNKLLDLNNNLYKNKLMLFQIINNNNSFSIKGQLFKNKKYSPKFNRRKKSRTRVRVYYNKLQERI